VKKRLDVLLVEKNIVSSREKAQAFIMEGKVLVNGKPITKAGTTIGVDDSILLLEEEKFVSRAGYKLENAIKDFDVDVSDKTCLDIGSSTGGFTDCLLQYGAKLIYAVDVGHLQMHEKLRKHPKVFLFEDTDIRVFQKPENIEFDIITVDVSFISLKKISEYIKKLSSSHTKLLMLVKPQFELSPKYLKKGIVKDESARLMALESVISHFESTGFKLVMQTKAHPKGTKGNEEFFTYFTTKEYNGIE
jgi:23S rRNA (cytidine1920-2'-O)/16S rRNA (cytidine1409-2'-O)-methyltransferase